MNKAEWIKEHYLTWTTRPLFFKTLGEDYRRDAIERIWTTLYKHKDNPENAKSELREIYQLSESEYSEVLNAFINPKKVPCSKCGAPDDWHYKITN